MMDLTLIEKLERGTVCYKLCRSTFCKGYYAIIAQEKKEFFCGSFASDEEGARTRLHEIAESETPPYTIRDILADFEKQKA